jgi:hypothetical protein
VPLDGTVFFIDRSIGRRVVADALRAAGATVKVHADEFEHDAADADWLLEVGKRGWVVLTQDKRIRFRELERIALRRAGVRAFIVTANNVTGPTLAELLVRRLSEIVHLADSEPAPFIALVSREGVRVKRY